MEQKMQAQVQILPLKKHTIKAQKKWYLALEKAFMGKWGKLAGKLMKARFKKMTTLMRSYECHNRNRFYLIG